MLAGAVALGTVATATAAPTPPKPPNIKTIPNLSVRPQSGKPHAAITITGLRFAPNQKIAVEMDCPLFGHSKNGRAHWTARTNAKGTFSLKTHVLQPNHVKTTNCGVYALNVTKKQSYYVSTEFSIK